MKSSPWRRIVSTTVLTTVALTVAACGADSSTPAESGSESAGSSGFEVAYLSASSANTWLQSSRKAMDEVSGKNDVTLTEFDAQFKPGEQSKQIKDVIASGKYKGIVIASVDGAGIIPDLEAAIAEGIQVAILNQVVGTALDTADPQFDGVAVSVLAPPLKTGERLGALAVKACEGVSPCRVVYFFGIKGTPIDTAIRQGFDKVVAQNPAIQVVAEGEGKYLGPDESLKALQDILQSTPDFEVVVGADQSIQGSALALQDAGKTGVKLIGIGGSEPALAGIQSGEWFGTVFGAPATEGRLALEALIKAVREGTATGGVDTASQLPDEGLVTKENASEFTPEWAG
jgi:ribose transport system substrate-binding protein